MFDALSLAANSALFIVSSIAVLIAGTRLARLADALQSRTGFGEALVGVFLLGFISALPELAVSVSASLAGNAQLAANNLLGGLALNIALLAAADAAVRHEALTSAVATPTPLLQAALLIVLLTVATVATLSDDVLVLGAGAWSWTLFAGYLLCARVIHATRGRQQPWIPHERPPARLEEKSRAAESSASARPLALSIAAAAAVILVAGYMLSQTGDALARQTGIGASFFGVVFLALATSLPEASIVFGAVRLGRYEMAIGDILGANLLGVALLFAVDLAYPHGPVFAELGPFSAYAALLAIAVTALFVAGLVERSHKRILRMGVDSAAVLCTYLVGLVVLYRAR
jgi:cation:H+ antiporter